MKEFEKDFNGEFSVKLIKELFQTSETHVFQAALRTPWLKNYAPFKSPMTDILIYSILKSANESVIECILTTHKEEINWEYIDPDGNSIFHIFILQTKLSDKIILLLIKTNDNKLNESINLVNNKNQSLLSISFNRQSAESQSISRELLRIGATIFVQNDKLYILPKFVNHIGYYNDQVAIILHKELENAKVFSLLSNPGQVIHNSRQFKNFKSDDLNRKEHFNSLLQILQFPCPNLIEVLLKEKLLNLNENFTCGSSLLHLAAEFGHTSVLCQILVTENLKLDKREISTENNALHKAILGKRCDNLKTLLMHDDPRIFACLNTKNKENVTPLELAIRNSFYSGISVLFENNLHILAVHWLPNVIIAIQEHKSDLLEVLLNFFSCPLSENSFLYEKTDPEGYSTLHIAVLHFKEEIFDFVLQKYIEYRVSSKQDPKLIDYEIQSPLLNEPSMCTALIQSLKQQQFSATVKLLKAGVSNLLQGNPCYFRCLVEYCHEEAILDLLLKIELKPTQFPITCNKEETLQIWQVLDHEHNTLLHYSLKCYNNIAVKLLGKITSFCDYSKLDDEGNSILHTAATLNCSNELTSEFIIALIRHKLNATYTKLIDLQEETNGYSALMLAVKYANSKIFNFLIEENASLLLFDKKHNSILHIIVEHGKVELFDIIMNAIDCSKCPNLKILFYTPNNEGNSPIEKAVLKVRIGILRSFRQIHNINFTNCKTGLSLLHLAVIITNINSGTRKELICEILTEMSLLESVDKQGQTPTLLAVSEQKVESLEILLTFNPNISVIDAEGFTMLQRAIEQFNKEIFNSLIIYITSQQNRREILNFLGNNGKNALSYSIEKVNYEATVKLLSFQPDLQTNDSEGNTYLHVACKFPESVNIMILLITHFHKQSYPNLLKHQNSNLLTPLLYAIYHKNVEACQVLLTHKVNLFYIDVDGVQQFITKVNSSKLTFWEYSKVYYVGYSFHASHKSHWVLCTLKKLSETRIISNTTMQSIQNINSTLVQATITHPTSQLLNILLDQLRPFPMDFNPISDLYIPAARNGSLDVINYLITQQISPKDYFNTYKSSILYESINNSSDEVVFRLCEKVSTLPDTDFKRVGKILITNQTIHPLILCLNLNKPRVFSYLLMEKFRIPLTFADKQGNTIIHEILRNYNRKEFLRILIDEVKKEKILVNKIPLVDCFVSDSMQTPLHICAQSYTDCLSMILELNPDPTSKDKLGNTPLHLAVLAKSIDRIRCIVEAFKKADEVINAINYGQHTPLSVAVIKGYEEIVKALLGYGANIYTVDAEKKTVLHHCVLIVNQDKSLSMVKIFLVHENNLSLNKNLFLQSDIQGMNTLHLAIKCSNIKATEYLLKQEPDLSSTDHNLNTVFHLAVEQKSIAILNLVLRANGLMENTQKSSSYEILNKKNTEGNTALSLAIRTGKEDYAKLILSIQPSLNICDNKENSPLHLAVQSQSENILSNLLRVMKSMNPDGIQDYLNAISSDGLSPLHYAIGFNNHFAARILCDHGSQLAISLPDGTLTLCNGKCDLNLRIISERTSSRKWNDAKTWLSADGCNYFVCYTFGNIVHPYTITCLLPELNTTLFYDSNKPDEMNNISEDALRMLTQCKSIEPLASAINNKLIDLTKVSSCKLLYNVLGTASIQVMEYLYTHYPEQMNTTESLKMLKDAVSITNNTDKIQDYLKRFPPLDNLNSPQINKNIDLQEVNNIIKESLRISLSNYSTTNLKTLLDHKARINYLYGDNDDHTTLLHIVLQLQLGTNLEFFNCILEEIEKREITLTKSTFINGIPLIECQNLDGKTVLHLCVEKGNKAMLEKLFFYIPDINKKDKSLNTIVHLVAKFSGDLIAQFIFDKIYVDEYPYYFRSVNNDGCSPLHLAAGAGNVPICSKLLDKGTPLYSIDKQQQTILHHSLKVENKALRLSTISFILTQHGNMKDFIRKQDKDGRTALHVAVFYQYEEEVNILIEADPSVIEICDNASQTPLHLAIAPKLTIPGEGIFKSLFAVLKSESLKLDSHHLKVRVISQQDVNGKTALHLSIQHQVQYALKDILSTEPCLDLPDNKGNTIIHEAVKNPSDDQSLDIIIKHIKDNSPRNLQEYLELKNSEGIPPLHYAIVNQHFQAAKLLIEEKASLYFINSLGNITLCEDIENLQLTFLLDCKTNKNANDRAYYIGYLIQRDPQCRWIISDLPKLSSTILTHSQSHLNCIESKNEFKEEKLLHDILNCHSSEPLASAFRRDFLNPSQMIRNKHITQIVGKSATPEVMRYYLSQFNGTVYQHMENCPCILESAVCNPDISTLCVVIQALPEDLIQESKIDQQLSQCLHNSLLQSLNGKDTQALDQLLKYHPSSTLTFTYGKNRGSLLHIGVNEGKRVEFAQSILKVACKMELLIGSKENTKFNLINFPDAKQRTVLHDSILTNREDMLTILLNYHPDLTFCDYQKDTALHLAVNCPRSQLLVRTLLRAMNNCQNPTDCLEARNKDGLTPLLLAITQSNPQIIQALLENKADFYARDPDNSTILHRVLEIQTPTIREAMMNTILEHEKKTLKLVNHLITSQQDLFGSTPLHIAVKKVQFDNVKALIAADSNLMSICDDNQQTVLHLSILSQHDEIFNLILKLILSQLLDSTCLFDKHILCFQDTSGKTPLHLSIEVQYINAFKGLLSNTCLNLVDNNQETVLHTAVRKSDDKCEILKDVIDKIREYHREEYFYSLNIKGFPPLQLAIELKRYHAAIELVKNLITLCFRSENNKIVLASKCGNINLQFLYEQQESSKIVPHDNFWIGYIIQIGTERNWIASRLPELKCTKYFKHDLKMQVSEQMTSNLLRSILTCHSSDPFDTAVKLGLINQNLINHELVREVGKHSTREVIEYFIGWSKLKIYEQINDQFSLFESVVANQDISVLNFLLEKLSDLSLIPPSEDNEDKEMITSCLKSSLNLSLQNTTVNALNEMLKYITKIDYTYDNADTLMHLIITGKRDPTFIESLLLFAERTTQIPKVRFIDIQNESKMTALHLALNSKEVRFINTLVQYKPSLLIHGLEGNTPLHLAIKSSIQFDIVEEIVKYSLKNREIINAVNDKSCTPLHFAVDRGEYNITKLLLNSNADIYSQDIEKSTVLHHAVKIVDQGKAVSIIDLLKTFENINFPSSKLNSIQDIEGQTPLHIAVTKSDIEVVNKLLDLPCFLSIKNSRHQTLVHLAVMRNNVDIFNSVFTALKLFEEWPTNIIPCNDSIANSQDEEGKTPLLLCIEYNNRHAFEVLLAAQPLLFTVDQSGNTVLHYAVRHNCPGIFLETLIPIVDPLMLTQQNNNDLPPLQYAIKHRNNTAILALINAGVYLLFKDRKKELTLCHSKDEMSLKIFKYKQNKFELWTGFDFKEGQSTYLVLSELPNLSKTMILHDTNVILPEELKSKYLKMVASCQCQEPLIAAFNIYKLNLKTNLPDGSDITETVAKCAPPESIECILKKDSSTLIKGRDGHLSMIESAVANPNPLSLEFLLNSISNNYSKQKVNPPTDGNFEKAKLNCLSNSLKLSLSNDNPSALAILLEYQTLMGILYDENDTLLHLIIKKDKSSEFIDKVFSFLNSQAKYPEKSNHTGICQYIDLQNECGLTALHVSIERGQEENVKTLLTYNPDIYLQDNFANTSLHYAAKQRKVTFVNHIIEATGKSSINTTNSKQETPLHVSVINGNKDVVELLLRSGAIYTMKSSNGYCILHNAVELHNTTDRTQLIEFILNYEKAFSKTNPSLTTYQDDIGFTPLMIAIQMRRIDAVENLISYDQTLRISDNAGQSPLHYAVLSLNSDIFDTVLKAITEKEDSLSKQKYTENNINVDKDWLEYRLICSRDNKGKTPLHLSIEKHNIHALETLLLCKPCLDTVDSKGYTLLHCTVKFDFMEGLRTILKEMKLRFHDDYSYFVNLSNANKLPPLHYAIKESNIECIKILLEHEVFLAFASASGEIILADGLDGLSLSFFEYQQNNIQYWTGYSFIFVKKIFWVLSPLPNLGKSILIENSSNIVRFTSIDAKCLQAISQSKSFEPLNAVIKTQTLTLDRTLGDILPMKLISQHGTRQSLRCLLKYMRPNLFTSLNGMNSIIECAVHNTDEDAFEFLLENLPEFCDELIPLNDENENLSENVRICLCFKKSFELSIYNPTPSTLISLLKYFPKLDYRYGENNNTLMHLMIKNEKSSVFINRVFTIIKELHLKLIKPENFPVINLQNSIGQTMTHLCIQKKQWENFNVLLNNFPNLHIQNSDDENSLHYAVRTSELNYVKKILEAVNDKGSLMSARNTSDFTALHLAIKQGNNDIAEFLLKSKSPFYPQKENEPTILHLAVANVSPESRITLIKTILIHEPQLHSATQRITCFKDQDGYSPLHLAVVNRCPNAVDHLLEVDLSPLLIRDKNKQTPLHLAIIPQCVGAQKYPDYSTEDQGIFTNVLKACINLHGEHKTIDACGAKHLICIQDNRKRTAIHYTLEYMNTYALKELLDTGSCLDIPDENGHISTHQAVDNPNDITCLIMLTEELERRYGDSLYAPFKFDSD